LKDWEERDREREKKKRERMGFLNSASDFDAERKTSGFANVREQKRMTMLL
jgi:hypothetical protein